MTLDWTKIGAIAAVAGVVVAIGLGALQYWDSIFSTKRLQIEIESVNWRIGEGRLGKGPYAIAKVQFFNSGSTPIRITRLTTKFALGSTTFDAGDIQCDASDHTWMGVPWDKLLRGPDYVEAVSINVPPHDIASEVVFFEPASVLTEADRKFRTPYKIFACLDISSVDDDSPRQDKRFPIGWIVFDDERIVDFVRSKENRGKLILGR